MSTAPATPKATKVPERPQPKPVIADIDIASISTNGRTQPRTKTDPEVVKHYADLMAQEGAEFPPVVVFHKAGTYWLADGFHRLAAARSNKAQTIKADVRTGDQRDAWLYARTEANRQHGLALSTEDKRARIGDLLADAECVKWSDAELARRCGVCRELVAKVRSSLAGERQVTERTYTNRHGGTSTMNVSRIGKAAPLAQAKSGPSGPTLDAAGRPIAPEAAEALGQAGMFKELVNEFHAMKREILALPDDGIGRALNKQRIERAFKDLVSAVGGAAPFTSCPLDHSTGKCKGCEMLGWMTELEWANVPREYKKAV